MFPRIQLLPVLLGMWLQTIFTPSTASAASADPQAVRGELMLRAQVANPYPQDGAWHYENLAMAAYWCNEKTAEADQAILTVREKEFLEIMKPSKFVKAGEFHWHAYLLERIYFLFGKDSRYFRGRMSLQAETALLEMLWEWASTRSVKEMTLPEHQWLVWGSENHQAQAWTGFWGAAHIFARHPDYKDRFYADGSTPAQMAAAFDGYFKRFARSRSTNGLLIECNSDYNKYTLGGWYNIADFAEDPILRKQMSQLLELFWADWAIEQIDGVRGGSRHRCYPGNSSTIASSMDGMAWFHFGMGQAKSQHPNSMCTATTFWRPSAFLTDLAEDVSGRGSYEYRSRRPGLMEPGKAGAPPANFVQDPKHPVFEPRGVYRVSHEGGALLRTTYCTPDFVLGTSMVEARPSQDWAKISSQNRWEGVILGGHPTARIFVQPHQPKDGSFYNASWSVQRFGVQILQRLKESNAEGQRVWFDASLRRVEREGWIFVEAPRAYAAVRIVEGGKLWEADSVAQHRGGGGATDKGEWLKCLNEFSPIVLEVVRKCEVESFEAFQQGILANVLHFEAQRLDYTSRFYQTSLTLFTDYQRPPLIDGVPVDYAPRQVYESPFIQSEFGSGVVRMQKGTQSVILDFNE